MASFRSCNPKGVGSVTSRANSAPCNTATSGHEVPGGESMITICLDSGLTNCFNCKITGTAIGSPIFNTPWANIIPSAVIPLSRTPITFMVSVIALSGQFKVQLPQPWHNSGKTSTCSATKAMALYWHTSTHVPHSVQRFSSIVGTGIPASCCASITGLRNRWALGASTSQSRNKGRTNGSDGPPFRILD